MSAKIVRALSYIWVAAMSLWVESTQAQVGLMPLAAAPPIDDGVGYYRRCVQFDPTQDKIDAERAITCSVFLSGLDEGIRLVVGVLLSGLPLCIPKDVELSKQSDIFESWLKANEFRIAGQKTVSLYWSALLEAYACSRVDAKKTDKRL